jgi:methylmalonyl-CoA/ethylmalonyl-CoA epimerase
VAAAHPGPSNDTVAPGPAASASRLLGRLHQIALKATDLEASVSFYRDVLALPFVARFDPPGLAFFDLGGSRLMLSSNSSEGTLYFAVSDIDAVAAELQGRGVVLAQAPSLVHRDDTGTFGKLGGEEWMAFFRDPSGNLLALVERR